jgi:hypothetical protein
MKDRPLAVIHARDEAGFAAAAGRITEAIQVGLASEFTASEGVIKQFKVPRSHG